jgi:hypothetical protein
MRHRARLVIWSKLLMYLSAPGTASGLEEKQESNTEFTD